MESINDDLCIHSHFASLWLQSPACFPLRHATHFPPLILSTPFIIFFLHAYFLVFIYFIVFTHITMKNALGVRVLNQLFPIIKKDYESKVTLISSLIMLLLFLSFSNLNFCLPLLGPCQPSAAFETQHSVY